MPEDLCQFCGKSQGVKDWVSDTCSHCKKSGLQEESLRLLGEQMRMIGRAAAKMQMQIRLAFLMPLAYYKGPKTFWD